MNKKFKAFCNVALFMFISIFCCSTFASCNIFEDNEDDPWYTTAPAIEKCSVCKGSGLCALCGGKGRFYLDNGGSIPCTSKAGCRVTGKCSICHGTGIIYKYK